MIDTIRTAVRTQYNHRHAEEVEVPEGGKEGS